MATLYKTTLVCEQGKAERNRYSADFGIAPERLLTIDEVVVGAKQVEDLLDQKALQIVQKELGLTKVPTKGQIKRFFQERLAGDQVQDLGPGFKSNARDLLSALKSRLGG
jgi:hypothetical protein